MAVPDRHFLGLALELSVPNAISPGISWVLLSFEPTGSFLASGRPSEVSKWRAFPVGGASHADKISRMEEITICTGGDGLIPTDRVEEKGYGLNGLESIDSLPGRERSAVGVADGRDIFCIVYTSGSTGRSKGVALTSHGQVRVRVGLCLRRTGTIFCCAVSILLQ